MDGIKKYRSMRLGLELQVSLLQFSGLFVVKLSTIDISTYMYKYECHY